MGNSPPPGTIEPTAGLAPKGFMEKLKIIPFQDKELNQYF
jgi:hypothetical protein